MNPYEEQQQQNNDTNQSGVGGYVNYYNPYVPSYVVGGNGGNGSESSTPVIIDSASSSTTQYYSSYPNSDTNYTNQYYSGGGGDYSNQAPPVSEPSIVVISERPVENVVNLPPQKIHNDDVKVDPVIQRELANSSNISAVSETAPAATTTYSNNNNYSATNNTSSNYNSRRRTSWKCPTISCSCPSFSSIDCDCSAKTKGILVIYGGGVLLVLIALALFGVGGALYGVVNSDYYCYNDPNGISYVHQGCCNATLNGCSYYKSNSYCYFTISFPRLGSAKIQQDPKKGFGLTCSAVGNQVVTMTSAKTYSSSFSLSMPSSSMIDCYTNKYETAVSLDPYSDLYTSYITGGVICFCFAAPILFFVFIKVAIWLYVKWKNN
ncbi:predicted protein [Naegleria gruberi]|uniref:Predicted protein n=1 Tax=Naegleria gruberi TaxID=5762 RepID=D2V6D5_NAEGR|nr:uncharacterized protein NAEGRDRAFT_64398 [Naegleria gruberi]EFC47552.1 predicted protein [Naegleria gruberi]|eukprot:XP_002680296.1 predicted protein [Naegleria gruberi strain NEG-M]